MTLSAISADIAPFFQYANDNNPSRIVNTWGEGARLRTRLVYQNCVSCNRLRFPDLSLSQRVGTNTYFCIACYTEFAWLIRHYNNLSPEENALFGQLVRDRFFAPRL